MAITQPKQLTQPGTQRAPQRRKENNTNMLNQLRRFAADSGEELEELVSLYAHAIQMEASFSSFNVIQPDWFKVQLKVLAREIRLRNGANLQRRLQEIRNRGNALKSKDEQRADLSAEAALIEQQLASIDV